jgi:hypothetical protein
MTAEVPMEERFDENLRIKFKGKMNFEFESFENCLPDSPDLLECMRKDCATAYNRKDDAVDTAAVGETDYAAEGCTYFQKADEAPRCWPEELALMIFRHHTRDAKFDPASSGAEWWTMVVNSESDIGFHWDRDYGLEGASGYNVHPQLGTVTYLTANGGPTVVLNKRGELLSQDDHSGDAEEMVVSRPKVGKHVKFDGRLLHAAPADLIPADPASRGVKRVTFLVNVWLNNIPLQTKRYPAAALGEFCAPSMALDILRQKWRQDGEQQKQQKGGAPFDLAAVLRTKRQKSGGGVSASVSTATGRGAPVMPGADKALSPMPVPDVTMAAQLVASRSKNPLQMRTWNFVNGGAVL